MRPLDSRLPLLYMRPTLRYANSNWFLKAVLIRVDVSTDHLCPGCIRVGICNALFSDCLDDSWAEWDYTDRSKSAAHSHFATLQVRESVHVNLVPSLPGCPYVVVCCFHCGCSLLAIFIVELWHVQLRWYRVLLALVVTLIFFVPVSAHFVHIMPRIQYWYVQLSVVYATSNIKVSIDIFCRIVSGFASPGKVLEDIWFFNLGYISVIKALGMAQAARLEAESLLQCESDAFRSVYGN